MDENANIYRAPKDEIPDEDKARLEGYLTAKAEAGELERAKERARVKYEAAWNEMSGKHADTEK